MLGHVHAGLQAASALELHWKRKCSVLRVSAGLDLSLFCTVRLQPATGYVTHKVPHKVRNSRLSAPRCKLSLSSCSAIILLLFFFFGPITFPCYMFRVHGPTKLLHVYLLLSSPWYLHPQPLTDLRACNQRKQFYRPGLISHVCDNSSSLHLLNLAPEEESSRARLMLPCLAKLHLPPFHKDAVSVFTDLNIYFQSYCQLVTNLCTPWENTVVPLNALIDCFGARRSQGRGVMKSGIHHVISRVMSRVINNFSVGGGETEYLNVCFRSSSPETIRFQSGKLFLIQDEMMTHMYKMLLSHSLESYGGHMGHSCVGSCFFCLF